MTTFRYDSFSTDARAGELACHYSLGDRLFTERVRLPAGPGWDTPAARAAARWVFLLAGVSYYKTAAPELIDLGEQPVTEAEREFLRGFYRNGLAEFAHRNQITVAPGITGGMPARQAGTGLPDGGAARPGTGAGGTAGPGHDGGRRALVPFGGGIDSVVTVERVRSRADVALFVVSRPRDRYAAIEGPAAVTGLPVLRAEREIDPQLFRSAELGFRNGHVPVTGIISAIAVLAAVLDGRGAVVMSNEWSASVPTTERDGEPVNHQWSKSAEFERGFRELLAGSGLPEYFSWLRDRTELWVGREFAGLTRYHSSFRSCNKAFYADPARRLDHWCGECDKCCFIDLILAPYLSPDQLAAIFAPAAEPLRDPALARRFAGLLGAGAKPFECVGEVTECRAAALLAAGRPDRAGDETLRKLAAEVRSWPDAPGPDAIAGLLAPAGANFIPAGYR